MRSALSLTLISLVCFAFVDNTDLPLAASSVETVGEEITDQFQEALNRWAAVLKATGGELAPDKWFYYLIDFKWTGKQWQYCNIQDMPAEFSLPDNNGTQHCLEQLEVDDARETLGVYVAMSGD